jgi:hypothetical protein
VTLQPPGPGTPKSKLWSLADKRIAVIALPLSVFWIFESPWLAVIYLVLLPFFTPPLATSFLIAEAALIVLISFDPTEEGMLLASSSSVRFAIQGLLLLIFAARGRVVDVEERSRPAQLWRLTWPIRALLQTAIVSPLAFVFAQLARGLNALESGLARPQGLSAAEFIRRTGPRLRTFLLLVILSLAVSLVFRGVPVLLVCGWIIALILIRRALPKSAAVKSSRAAQIGNVALLTISTLLALAVLEVGLRIVRPFTEPSQLVVEDPAYFVKLPPNATAKLPLKIEADEMKEIEVSTSSQGLRDRDYGPKQPDEYRILLIGDSYTFGHGLETEETISRQLEDYLAEKGLPKHVTVMNGGVIRYGPWQERGFLNERGFNLEPDLVILQIFPGNDIANTLARDGKLLRAYSMQQVIWSREKFYRDNWQVRANYWLSAHCAIFRYISDAIDQQAALVRLLDSLVFFKPSTLYKVHDSADRPDYLEPLLITWYGTLEEGWEALEKDVLGIRQDCADRHIDFMVYAVPDIHSVCEWAWVLDLYGFERPDIYQKGRDMEVAEDFFKREALQYIDLYTPFTTWPAPCELYYFYDWHFTRRGAKLTADTIGDYLLSTVFTGVNGPADLPPSGASEPNPD